MTSGPVDIRAARGALGEMWGLGRPLALAEMGRVLGFKSRDPGRQVKEMEDGRELSGPVVLAVGLMLDGARPSDLDRRLAPRVRQAE